MQAAPAVDGDAREALEAMIKTYRTRESGIIYESRPENPYAAGIQEALKGAIEDLRNRLAQETGVHTIKDSELLGVLVFLQRLEIQHNNGRKKGRAFLDLLRSYFPMQPAQSLAS